MIISFRNKKYEGDVVMIVPNGTVERLLGMWSALNEKQKRRMAAYEAKAIGHGGIRAIAEIVGLGEKAISRGIKDLANSEKDASDKRARKKGGGRKKKGKRVLIIKRSNPRSSSSSNKR